MSSLPVTAHECRVRHARVIVDRCEQALRRSLTSGEKRDLLADRTDWPLVSIRNVVATLEDNHETHRH